MFETHKDNNNTITSNPACIAIVIRLCVSVRLLKHNGYCECVVLFIVTICSKSTVEHIKIVNETAG